MHVGVHVGVPVGVCPHKLGRGLALQVRGGSAPHREKPVSWARASVEVTSAQGHTVCSVLARARSGTEGTPCTDVAGLTHLGFQAETRG